MDVNKVSESSITQASDDKLSVLIVSGRSGSGKTSVLNNIEDLG